MILSRFPLPSLSKSGKWGRNILAAGAPLIIAFVLLGPESANGAALYSHSGATDPTSEGWIAGGAGVGVTTGTVFNDLGSGTDAWFVNELI